MDNKIDVNSKDLQVAAINLFHAVKSVDHGEMTELSEMIKYGILPVNKDGIVKEINSDLYNIIIDSIGLNPVKWTSSFHKSWDKVATASAEQLVAEQLINYFGTYGMEELNLPIIDFEPVEIILTDADDNPAPCAFTVIRVLSEDELREEFCNYIKSVKSLNIDSLIYIYNFFQSKDFLKDEITLNDIRSFEVKAIYYKAKNIVPANAQDFLRLAVFNGSGFSVTRLVKDKETIDCLRYFAMEKEAVDMFKAADLKVLSESFFRFKPLFLAFKANKEIAPLINKIRRYATTYHKPVSGFTVSNIMNLLAMNRCEDAKKVIEKADMRELIKLINFSNYELVSEDHIYNIRNGKVFVKTGDDMGQVKVRIESINWLADTCKKQIISRCDSALKGITFYIPENIKYTVPVSEKQMFDVLPYGSKVMLPKDAEAICIGGHWFNNKEYSFDDEEIEGRIDLDFHLTSKNGSIGWNSDYRTDDNSILFSGDMTNAPEPFGAVEAFRIASDVDVPYQMSINIYNASGNIPFELIFTKDVTKECEFKADEDSMISAVINPANAIAPILKLHVRNSGAILGYYYNKAFTIYGGGIGGNARVPDSKLMMKILHSSVKRCDTMMDMVDFIELAGGKVVHVVEPDLTEYVDLSMGNLTATTLFDIVDLNADRLPHNHC